MVGLLEKYKLWEQGRLTESMHPTTLAFFRENPTEKQLLILSDRDNKQLYLFILGLAVYTIFGLAVGIVIGLRWGLVLG